MPEGDTLHFFARSVRPRLVGEPIAWLRLRDRGEVEAVRGCPIDAVEVVGKHLLVHIGRRHTLHVHLGLRGRWRTYDAQLGPGEPIVTASTVALAVPSTVLAVFRSAIHELRPYHDMRLEHRLRRLGPDLLAPDLELDVVVARARTPGHADVAITDLLLDQGVAAGIGNVYRSEVLFLTGTHPWTPVASLDDAQLRALFDRAQALMTSNVGPGRRATVGHLRGARRPPGVPRLWVYRRERLPCLRCRTPIQRSIAGRRARSTYWCPRCQPAPRAF